MDDKSGDDDTGEVRWSWRRDESGRGRSRRGWRSAWGSWFQWCEAKRTVKHGTGIILSVLKNTVSSSTGSLIRTSCEIEWGTDGYVAITWAAVSELKALGGRRTHARSQHDCACHQSFLLPPRPRRRRSSRSVCRAMTSRWRHRHVTRRGGADIECAYGCQLVLRRPGAEYKDGVELWSCKLAALIAADNTWGPVWQQT